MCRGIDKVFQLARTAFARNGLTEVTRKNLELLVSQTNKLIAEDVGLDLCDALHTSGSPLSTDSPGSSRAPVTYIPVSETKDFSIGIFVIREGEAIPMHDHPHMHGIIRCLSGSLKITSCTRTDIKGSNIDIPDRIQRSPQLMEKLRFGELFLAEQDSTSLLTTESGSCILEADKCNIHRVESVGGPAAFLDILAPPYNIDPHPGAQDSEERDCHYFREIHSQGLHHKWLLLSEPPSSFFCDTEPYRGPRVQEDSSASEEEGE